MGLEDALNSADQQAESKQSKQDLHAREVEKEKAVAAAVNASKERMKAILNCESATQNQTLASHLAWETTLCSDEAIAIMKAANQGFDQSEKTDTAAEYEAKIAAENIPVIGVDAASSSGGSSAEKPEDDILAQAKALRPGAFGL